MKEVLEGREKQNELTTFFFAVGNFSSIRWNGLSNQC